MVSMRCLSVPASRRTFYKKYLDGNVNRTHTKYMSNDRIPVALKYAPSRFAQWAPTKVGLAEHAARREFPDANVILHPWGLQVLVSVPCVGAIDYVVRGNAKLKVACEYAVVDEPVDFLEHCAL